MTKEPQLLKKKQLDYISPDFPWITPVGVQVVPDKDGDQIGGAGDLGLQKISEEMSYKQSRIHKEMLSNSKNSKVEMVGSTSNVPSLKIRQSVQANGTIMQESAIAIEENFLILSTLMPHEEKKTSTMLQNG